MPFTAITEENLTQKCQRWFWWFLIIHNIVWIILPTWLRYALPHDTIEGALWGQHLELGYDKNPWMNAWLTRLGWAIGGISGVGIYAMSSIFVAISFWSVWRLANKMLNPLYALIAVLLLEGCINYTLVPQAFNDNLIELGLWPLMFLCFYQALEQQKIRDWLATGIVASLAMMAKYYTAIPLAVMLIFLLGKKEGRRSFYKPGIYISLLSFLLICLPHIIWLFQHHFITIAYAVNRAENIELSRWRLHLLYPFDFAVAQIINFIFPLFLLLFLYSRQRATQQHYLAITGLLPTFARQFLLTMAFGPFLLTVLLAIVFGWRLFNEWGVPLASLWGLILIAFSQPRITTAAFKRFFIVIYIVMFLWATVYALGLSLDKKHRHSDNYPAQEIADYVTQQWHAKYHKPLKYVAGSRYIAGYIAFYSADHPSVYVEWNDQFSPWIDVKAMKKYGAVFVQDNYYGTTVFGDKPNTDGGKYFPPEVLQHYPHLKTLPVKNFQWHRTGGTLKPIPVLIGFLPPEPNN